MEPVVPSPDSVFSQRHGGLQPAMMALLVLGKSANSTN